MKKKKLKLFQAMGVELEYMIVKKDALTVAPIADVLLRNHEGEIMDECTENGVAWSNELVSHVIEMKSDGPAVDFSALESGFTERVKKMNDALAVRNACLLPTAAHPWMDPMQETILWPYANKDIYVRYDQMFGCKGHGWSNLQSMHLNLPFSTDDEFHKLHTAIRFLLPLIPALSASSPILDGKFTGIMDRRLEYYESNQSKFPILTGGVIPEAYTSEADYQKRVYDPIMKAIASYNEDELLEAVWMNSRGAIARFDRGAIEIRIMDLQESPRADMALAGLVFEVLQMLVSETLVSTSSQKQFTNAQLYNIYRLAVKQGGKAMITDKEYLSALGFDEAIRARDIWKGLHKIVNGNSAYMIEKNDDLEWLLSRGTLAERIVQKLGKEFTNDQLSNVYRDLSVALASNYFFE